MSPRDSTPPTTNGIEVDWSDFTTKALNTELEYLLNCSSDCPCALDELPVMKKVVQDRYNIAQKIYLQLPEHEKVQFHGMERLLLLAEQKEREREEILNAMEANQNRNDEICCTGRLYPETSEGQELLRILDEEEERRTRPITFPMKTMDGREVPRIERPPNSFSEITDDELVKGIRLLLDEPRERESMWMLHVCSREFRKRIEEPMARRSRELGVDSRGVSTFRLTSEYDRRVLDTMDDVSAFLAKLLFDVQEKVRKEDTKKKWEEWDRMRDHEDKLQGRALVRTYKRSMAKYFGPIFVEKKIAGDEEAERRRISEVRAKRQEELYAQMAHAEKISKMSVEITRRKRKREAEAENGPGRRSPMPEDTEVEGTEAEDTEVADTEAGDADAEAADAEFPEPRNEEVSKAKHAIRSEGGDYILI